MKTKIPDRWLDYSAMGAKVAGTRFIAFKAPLSKEICAKMKPNERFTPEILVEQCPNMRLIIDLTNTDRYYNKQEFIDRGIQYEKIMCPGQVIPPQSLIFRFFEIIDDFYLKNGLKDVLIGIHCTHGVNRTGYFIGRYMVQRMGFHYEKAIPCIEEARGHKIERGNYIKDLMVQVPIPSSLSSSSGKKVIDTKPQPKKSTNNISGKAVGKLTKEKSPPEKPYSKKGAIDSREPPRMRKQEQGFKGRAPPPRPDNFGPGGARAGEADRRGMNSPSRRPPSPRRGFSPSGRRGPSPRRAGGRPPSPKRRVSPRQFSPPRRRTPPRRSPPRRFSPPRREGDFNEPQYRDNSDYHPPRNNSGGFPPRREYSPRRSPPRRMDPPHKQAFPPRDDQSFGPPHGSGSWQYENKGFHTPGGPPPHFGPPPNQFTESRLPERNAQWDNRQSNFNDSRPPYSGPPPQQWNSPQDFSVPPPPMNPNFESRHGGFNNPPPGRFNERRFDEPKFPPPREEPRRSWDRKEERPNNGPPPFNAGGRFPEERGFPEAGNNFRGRPEGKYEKPYRSPPRGEPFREKRYPSPSREPRREFNDGFKETRGDVAPGWDNRRRSPVPFGDKGDPYGKGSSRRRSKSPMVRRPRSRTPPRRSPPRRSPPRRRTPPRESFEQRRSPPRSHQQPPPHQMHAIPQFGPPRDPPPPFQDKRFYPDPKDDCRDLLNQKRNFDGDRAGGGGFYEPKTEKLGVRDIPKEIDLRNVIGSGADSSNKNRLGAHRDEPVDRKYTRGRSRSPRGRSPHRYSGPPRRY